MSDSFLNCFRSALRPTCKSALWLLRLLIPISLGVALLQHWGVLSWLALYLNPVFTHLGLPGTSAVIFLSGAAAGTYAGIAALVSIQLTLRQATILGIMTCICHALPMECAVNRMTGSSFWRMAFIRVVAAFLCALYLNLVLPDMPQAFHYMGAPADSTLWQVLHLWAVSQTKMAAIVFLIIYILMLLQRMIETYGLLRPISRVLAPVMSIFGLPREVAYMWLVGNVLGLSYGSAVMVELEEKGIITREQANDVNYHLIMNHSLLEDTIIFSATGIPALWIVSTRILFAFLLVWGRKAIKMVAKAE